MKIGVVYPQIEYSSEPSAIRDYAQTAEALGYTHILAYDHVLGANPDRPGGWKGPYTHKDPFQEPFVLFSYMAALTRKIGFVTGILILTQRQTALVAKQAATLDSLSQGRFRMGVGIGWNEVEYEALNENMRNRGRRIEEQVALLRQFWTQPLVTFHGRWHNVSDAGVNPLPVQRPIPIWFGGQAEEVLRRTARMGDGWMPNSRDPDVSAPLLEMLDRFLEENGRKRSDLGIEARIPYGDGNLDTLRSLVEKWQVAGATHIDLNTMGSGFTKAEEHLRAINLFADRVMRDYAE
jgi:probable F420-dependent oxidoreductase